MPKNIKNGSDTEKPYQYALKEKGESGLLHAEEFRQRMDEFRAYMTSPDAPVLQNKMVRDLKYKHDWDMMADMCNVLFSTENVAGKDVSWESAIFDGMPAAAVYAMLTKYQCDIRTAENEALNMLFSAAGRSR